MVWTWASTLGEPWMSQYLLLLLECSSSCLTCERKSSVQIWVNRVSREGIYFCMAIEENGRIQNWFTWWCTDYKTWVFFLFCGIAEWSLICFFISCRWQDFERNMFWVSIVGGGLAFLHLLTLLYLRWRTKTSLRGGLSFPRFEIFLLILFSPAICQACAFVIRGKKTWDDVSSFFNTNSWCSSTFLCAFVWK